ncbi:hypothetical protein [Magnetospirillum fulvum]|uniref:Uncharacterized protein n=1 Tax=Magnetospirillum fulvum TaxID=1082 RepID=A0A1H6H5S5_MAGFU|nr:hypothetical protein [Magnetospirillum fulvum]SEH31197.1 hypothetical protein SAMN04244559_01100 [Magnetospirillum fulvum]
METVIRDVTLETVNQAIANRAGIKPGESFSVVIVDSVTRPRSRLSDVAGKARVPVASKGLATDGAVIEPGEGVKSRMARLLELKGVGARLYGERTQEDIDAGIREFRGDE